MQLRVVDGNDAKPHRQSSLISYLVNRNIAFDAGALGLIPLPQQKAIQTIFLSHCHADHIATLPLFIDNVYKPGPECVRLFANESTIADLKAHVFNDRIWPDVMRLSELATPFIEFRTIRHGDKIEVDDICVTAFDVNHTIPTTGFVIEDQDVAIALVADTAPDDSIWHFLKGIEKLSAVFMEISFPNSMQWLAEAAKHLTPQDFLQEMKKLERSVDWYITHVKPEFTDVITREVGEWGIDICQFAIVSKDYHFEKPLAAK